MPRKVPTGSNAAPDTAVETLANGVRLVTIALPHLATAAVSVFVHSGSQHESARLNGISHVVEHMAFKGTARRNCQQINLDAERLGAEVNAHTDKDHTAFHMRGLAGHAGDFIGMLGEIVRESNFPEAELERERQVILHEYAEDEDDALANAFVLFDRACYGEHPVARPVIGSRRNIQRFKRADLVDYVASQYSGANTIVGVVGGFDLAQVRAATQAAFATMPAASPQRVATPSYRGGIASRHLAGTGQAHLVLGFPVPAVDRPHASALVAAALLGEGMSSPLLDELRERRALVYHAACSADIGGLCGQMVIEASTSPQQLEESIQAIARLLQAQLAETDPVGLVRARNQIIVRSLCTHEQPVRRLEAAALDLFNLGRVRSRDEQVADVQAVQAEDVRQAFAQMLAAGPAVALAGKFARASEERVRDILGQAGMTLA